MLTAAADTAACQVSGDSRHLVIGYLVHLVLSPAARGQSVCTGSLFASCADLNVETFFARSCDAMVIFLLTYSIENYFYTLLQKHYHARYCIIGHCLAKFTWLLSRGP